MHGVEEGELGKKKKKKKSKKKKAAADAVDADDPNDFGLGPPKPRNFLEAALYFSTVTLGTVSMANQLDCEVFFAPPLFTAVTRDEFARVFAARRVRSGAEYDQLRYLQRRISALFAVALSQASPTFRPFAMPGVARGNGPTAQLAKTNYLKRSIGFFAVSLVDHLPPNMSNRFFSRTGPNGMGTITPTGAGGKSLGLDDLRVPSPEQLATFWLSMSDEERLQLVQEESVGLAKGWINAKKAWCMCKYCKHRRLRLSDIFDHVYRAYYDELQALACRLRGEPVPELTANQAKIRRLMYKALSVVGEDILNTKSRLMLESISRLGRIYHEDSTRNECTGTSHCHCPDCDYYDEEDPDYRADCEDCQDSDFDDLDIDEDGDFYEDFNYGEDDEYIQQEGDVPVDEAQLPSTLPSFYDMDLITGPGKGPLITDHAEDGQTVFEHFVSQVFQFHLVPAFLEYEALQHQRELIAEEEAEETEARLREEHRALAKQKKKERQKAAKASKAPEPEPAPQPEPQPVAEAPRPAPAPAPVPKKKAPQRPAEPPAGIVPRPQVVHVDTRAFAVEDICQPAPAASAGRAGDGLSKSARRKAKKKLLATTESSEGAPAHDLSLLQSTHADSDGSIEPDWDTPCLSTPWQVPHDMPPGIFTQSTSAAPSALQSPPALDDGLDPPPPYSLFEDMDLFLNEDEGRFGPAAAFAPPRAASPPTSSRFESLFASRAGSIYDPAGYVPPILYRAQKGPYRGAPPPGFHHGLNAEEDPVYVPPAPPAEEPSAAPGRQATDGFTPFDTWSPINSSLFSSSIFSPPP